MLNDPDPKAAPRLGHLRPAPTSVGPVRYEGVPALDGPVRPGPAMPEDLTAYWQRVVKHRWLIAITIVVCLAIGAAATLLTRPAFTARTMLQIDRESAKVVNVEAVTPNEQMISGEEFFQTQYGLLRSDSLADRVSDSLGLARDDSFVRAMAGKVKRGWSAAERQDAVSKLLRDHLGVTPTRGSRLVALTFTSPDPQMSAKIANAFADNFIETNIDRRFESSSYARDFLEKRLAQTKAKLEQQERELVAYAASHGIIQLTDGAAGPGAAGGQSLQAADLSALNASLAAAHADRIRAQQRWADASTRAGADIPEVLQNTTIQQLTEERAKKMAEYQDKLAIFRAEYPDVKQLKAQIDELDRQINRQTESVRQSIKAQFEIASADERALQAKVEGLKGSVLDLRDRSIQYTILQREVDTSRTLYDGLLQRYKEVGVAGGVTTNNISIVDHAKPPRIASEPKPVRNMAIALLIGGMLGLALAFLREALDQAVRAPADVENALRLPVLGSIPILPKGTQAVEALADTRSPMSEAYFSLRSALQFSTTDGFPKTLLVTSTRTAEGKSTTAYALAQSVARLGFRTLLTDGDLRNPSLHRMMGVDSRDGLSSFLTGASTLREIIQEADAPNLFIIPAGPLPPNPAELLAGERLGRFLAEAAHDFDMVIIDGPPVLGLADAPLISAAVGGVILLVEAGRTGRNQARAALRRLQMVGAHVLGVVLTKFNANSAAYGYGYAYEYEYAYGPGPAGPKSPRFNRLKSEAKKLMSR